MNRVGRVMAAGALVACASAASAQTYDFSELTALAQAAVRGDNVESAVPGFELLVLKDGQPIYRRAFGLWTLDRPANADSATKTLSGALIMSVTEQSALPFSLDSRLQTFIPQFDGEKATMTIRQCFSHTAGTGQTGAEGANQLTLLQAARLIAAIPLEFPPPGSVFSYGGSSMHAAGAAAEIAAGVPWNTLFQQRLAGPLGLTVTRYVLTTPSNPRIAGGAESTAVEFGVFMEMLRRGGLHGSTRVLRQSSVDTMFTRQTPLNIPVANSPYNGSADYGVGVWLDERFSDGSLRGAQAAGARGFSSWIDFDDGLVGVFSTDLTQGSNIRELINQMRDAAARAVQRCEGDINRDGVADQGDVACLIAAVAGDTSCAGEGYVLDLNADGSVDQGDVDFLVTLVAGGGCP